MLKKRYFLNILYVNTHLSFIFAMFTKSISFSFFFILLEYFVITSKKKKVKQLLTLSKHVELFIIK